MTDSNSQVLSYASMKIRPMPNSKESQKRRISVAESFSVERSRRQVPTISSRLAAGFSATTEPNPRILYSTGDQNEPQMTVVRGAGADNNESFSRPASRQSRKKTGGLPVEQVSESDRRSGDGNLPEHLDITILSEDEDLEHQLLSLVSENHQKSLNTSKQPEVAPTVGNPLRNGTDHQGLQNLLQQGHEPKHVISNLRATPGQSYIQSNWSSESHSSEIRSGMFDGSATTSVTSSRDVLPLPIDDSGHRAGSKDIWRYLSQDQGDTVSAKFLSSGSRHSTFGTLPSLHESHNPSLTMNPLREVTSTLDSGLMLRSGSKLVHSGLTPSTTVPIDFQSSVMNCPRTMYQKRTTSLSHAMMTLALLSASTAQLRFIVAYADVHAYPTLNYFLICTCVVIEIFVGIGYVILARFDFSDDCTDKLHSYLIFGLFIVTAANVIVAVFALDDHICGYKTVSAKSRSVKFGVDEDSSFAEEKRY